MLIEQQGGSNQTVFLPSYPVTQLLPRRRKMQPAPKGGVPYLIFVPNSLLTTLEPLVLIHGISRNARQHVEAFSLFAERTGRMLIAPVFDHIHCKRYQQARTKQCHADKMLIATLEDARRLSNCRFQQIMLYGFSGGAQFSHRFAMLHPNLISRLMIASAGWYTFPNYHQPFPYGTSIKNNKGISIAKNITQFLSTPTLVMVGELDIKRDSNLRKGKIVDPIQGLSRVERAARWVRAVRKEASILGIESNFSFQILPNCTHSFYQCAQQGKMIVHITDWLTTINQKPTTQRHEPDYPRKMTTKSII